MSEVHNRMGQSIKRLRNLRGMTQSDLAEKLNFDSTTISKWETGNRKPDSKTIMKLAKLFDVSTDVIHGFEQYDDRNNTVVVDYVTIRNFEYVINRRFSWGKLIFWILSVVVLIVYMNGNYDVATWFFGLGLIYLGMTIFFLFGERQKKYQNRGIDIKKDYFYKKELDTEASIKGFLRRYVEFFYITVIGLLTLTGEYSVLDHVDPSQYIYVVFSVIIFLYFLLCLYLLYLEIKLQSAKTVIAYIDFKYKANLFIRKVLILFLEFGYITSYTTLIYYGRHVLGNGGYLMLAFFSLGILLVSYESLNRKHSYFNSYKFIID